MALDAILFSTLAALFLLAIALLGKPMHTCVISQHLQACCTTNQAPQGRHRMQNP